MKLRIFLCFIVLSATALGQRDIDDPLDRCNFSADAIQKNSIRSVLVFVEQIENVELEKTAISGKAREYEFDSLGNVIYRIDSYSDGYYPFAEYGRGSELEFSEYNDKGLRTHLHKESYQMITEYIQQFDQNDYLTLSEIIYDGKGMSGHSKVSFEWKDGQMVEAEQLLPIDEGNDYSAEFDDQGRAVEYGTPSSMTIVSYKDRGDTLTSIYEYFRDDTLMSTTTFSELKQFKGQYAYYATRDEAGNLTLEVRIVHDDQGNIIRYTREDHVMKRQFEGIYEREPEVIEVVNHYDHRGLLIKQEFYLTVSDSIKKQLYKVLRYVYEETPLRFKFKKGELRAKEIEMNENDGRDY